MSTDAISVDVVEHVAVVEIHRPPHNWFDLEVLTALADAVLELDDVVECRASVLCSEGRNFCAGANLGGTDLLDDTASLYREATRLFSNRKPIVAAVQGAAVGGGLGLALTADFRVATAKSRFSCNFAKLGFHHGFAISVTLPAVVGQQEAWRMLFTGEDVRGDEALRIGLVDQLAAPESLRDDAIGFARRVAACAPLAVMSIRRTMRGDLLERVRAAIGSERVEQQRLRRTADFQEGVAAVKEQRPARFTGR